MSCVCCLATACLCQRLCNHLQYKSELLERLHDIHSKGSLNEVRLTNLSTRRRSSFMHAPAKVLAASKLRAQYVAQRLPANSDSAPQCMQQEVWPLMICQCEGFQRVPGICNTGRLVPHYTAYLYSKYPWHLFLQFLHIRRTMYSTHSTHFTQLHVHKLCECLETRCCLASCLVSGDR